MPLGQDPIFVDSLRGKQREYLVPNIIELIDMILEI